jgi:hypothetical protein
MKEDNMKHIYTIFLFCMFYPLIGIAQNEQPNVMSYYAVGNSLDGQLMSDMQNILRFFPVYAMQKKIDSVRVTVYYGGKIFSRFADHASNGDYWEVLLPQFKLGESIQRMEVETFFRLPDSYRFRLAAYDTMQLFRIMKINLIAERLEIKNNQQLYYSKRLVDSIQVMKSSRDKIIKFSAMIDSSNKRFKEYNINDNEADGLRIQLSDNNYDNYIKARNKLLTQKSILSSDTLRLIDGLVQERVVLVQSYQLEFFTKSQIAKTLQKQVEFLQNQALQDQETLDSLRQEEFTGRVKRIVFLDSLKRMLDREIEIDLTDTMYVGPSIRKSDVVIDSFFVHGRLLYRNYKPSLRYMPALDPGERMGIFRVRYVPFPIVGTAENSQPTLLKPMSPSSPTVFEIGLAFGNAIVPGDDFVPAEFSWKRLGVAFAITERLFSDSAQVIGLALTYDFNSYGSIGIGGNFAQNTCHWYFSLGINKKAFEAVVTQLAKLF